MNPYFHYGDKMEEALPKIQPHPKYMVPETKRTPWERPKMQQLSTRISSMDIQKLKNLSDITGKPFAFLVRKAIRLYLDAHYYETEDYRGPRFLTPATVEAIKASEANLEIVRRARQAESEETQP